MWRKIANILPFNPRHIITIYVDIMINVRLVIVESTIEKIFGIQDSDQLYIFNFFLIVTWTRYNELKRYREISATRLVI